MIYLRLLIILIVAIPSWYYTDMDSMSLLRAYLLPVLLFFSFLAFCLWLIDLFEHLGKPAK
ncbi:MAG: hypothetical protein QNJ69_02500 [Gammaproteobacteria bacterium]|nr:hypothetical protein [Gammaproteobacteria bacterium]